MSMDITVYKVLSLLPVMDSVTERSRVIAVPESAFSLIERLLPIKVTAEPGKDYAILHIVFEEKGYMRKPFRDMDDDLTERDESAEFIASNIKNAVRNINRLQHPMLSDSNFAVLGFEDLALLDELGQYSHDPAMWETSITNEITNSSLIVLDW